MSHKDVKEILCLGAGYVGGPTMAVIAEKCHDINVTVVDLNEDRIKAWNSDSLPVYEPGLDEMVKGRRGKNLHFKVASSELLASADMIFVSVNTPTKMYGQGAGRAADLRFWELAARDILKHAKSGTIIVEKSTVPVKTAEAISRILHSGTEGKQFSVLSNPEFLAEGTAIKDLLNPDRVLIGNEPGEEGKAAGEALANVYRRWVPTDRVLLTNVWSSELSKLVANAFLAQRVSSINSVSAICEATGADVSEISRAIGMDSRIGPKFLQAGVGFGGSCFKKDILNLSYICETFGLSEVAAYWRSVVDMNDYQMERFVKRIVEAQFNTVAGKKQALLGFAFKPDTNDTRETPALTVTRKLLEEKAKVVIHDPEALENAKWDLKDEQGDISYEPDVYKACEGAHSVIILTHWQEYRELDYERIFSAMEKPAFLFDGRLWLNPEKMHKIGFNYLGIGSSELMHI
ncbi:MAG: nucleotide sugar dehydrogenase [Leptospiraceae bacterium]|nr:nucleotide sugar dehydrogenase [Leptospiraceae bacterium]